MPEKACNRGLRPKTEAAIRDVALTGESLASAARRHGCDANALARAWRSPAGRDLRQGIQDAVIEAHVRIQAAISLGAIPFTPIRTPKRGRRRCRVS